MTNRQFKIICGKMDTIIEKLGEEVVFGKEESA